MQKINTKLNNVLSMNGCTRLHIRELTYVGSWMEVAMGEVLLFTSQIFILHLMTSNQIFILPVNDFHCIALCVLPIQTTSLLIQWQLVNT